MPRLAWGEIMNALARYRLVTLSLVITGVIAGTVGQAFAGAREWTRFGSSPSVDADIVVLSPGFAVDKTVFIGGQGEDEGATRSNDGVMKSTDAGRTWVKVGFTQGVRNVTALAVAPDYVSSGIVLAGAASQYGTGGMLRSSDRGATWVRVGVGAGITDVIDIQFSPAFATDGTIFASTDKSGGKAFLISHDGGLTWQSAGSAAPIDTGGRIAVSPQFAADNTVLMVTSDGGPYPDTPSLCRSVDGGLTWNGFVGAGLPDALFDVGISPMAGGSQTLLAVAQSSEAKVGVYRSTDGGATWTQALKGVDHTSAWIWSGSRFVFSPNWAIDKAVFIVLRGQLYKSANAGASFYQVGVMELEADMFAELNEALAIRSDFASAPVVFSGSDSLYSGGSNQDVWTYTFSPPVKARLSKPVVSTGADMKGRLIVIKGSLSPLHVEAAPRLEYRLYRKRGTAWVKYKFYPRPSFRVGGFYPDSLYIYWNSLPRGQYKVMTYHADSGETGHLPSSSLPTYFTRGSGFSYWTKR
jgi:hypothetical protein